MKTATAEVVILNVMGIHLRPASSMVQAANRYPNCEIRLTKNGQTVDGKSIMSVIMLAAEQGSTLKVETMGDECESLLQEIIHLIENKFGEE